jgi:hypothetical protein
VLDLLGEASAESIAVTGKAAEILNVKGFSPFWGRQIMVLPTQMEVVPKVLSKD